MNQYFAVFLCVAGIGLSLPLAPIAPGLACEQMTLLSAIIFALILCLLPSLLTNVDIITSFVVQLVWSALSALPTRFASKRFPLAVLPTNARCSRLHHSYCNRANRCFAEPRTEVAVLFSSLTNISLTAVRFLALSSAEIIHLRFWALLLSLYTFISELGEKPAESQTPLQKTKALFISKQKPAWPRVFF